MTCKVLVLALGAKNAQSLLRKNSAFDRITQDPEKLVLSSQQFIMEKGYLKALRFLKNVKRSQQQVAIIGGSHSAFACAHLLLHGAKVFSRNEITRFFNTDFAQKRKHGTRSSQQESNQWVGQNEQESAMFGSVESHPFPDILANSDLINSSISQVSKVTIYYRKSIKVFFDSVQEAQESGYVVPEPGCVDSQGRVCLFSGLRGCYKDLYLNVHFPPPIIDPQWQGEEGHLGPESRLRPPPGQTGQERLGPGVHRLREQRARDQRRGGQGATLATGPGWTSHAR